MDERDAQVEMQIDGYRVAVIRSGRRVSTFNVDDCSVEQARAWAMEHSGDGGYSLAARFDHSSGGGVTLMWLTPPPEDIMDEVGG